MLEHDHSLTCENLKFLMFYVLINQHDINVTCVTCDVIGFSLPAFMLPQGRIQPVMLGGSGDFNNIW